MDRDDELFEEEIAEAIQQDYAEAQREARVPPAELVWMRAELRAREEAVRKAVRPMVLTQALTIAGLIGVLLSLGGRLSLRTSIWTTLSDLPFQASIWPLAIALAGWIVLAPVALYLAFSRD